MKTILDFGLYLSGVIRVKLFETFGKTQIVAWDENYLFTEKTAVMNTFIALLRNKTGLLVVLLLLLPSMAVNSSNYDTAKEGPGKKKISDREVFTLLDLDHRGMEEVKKAYNNGNLKKAKAAYLKFRREKSKTQWHINPSNMPEEPESSSYPEANNIMNHIIPPSQGAPEAHLGEDINWKFNPVDPSQPHFTKEWTWQNLNRMGMWNTLGEAYWHTLDEKYAREWVDQMMDWVEENPVPFEKSPGATLCWRTIEAGIRMSGSWMNAYYHFLYSPSFTPEANLTFVKGIIMHGWRLKKVTLDYPERTGNWVTMECNGLGTIGTLFPELDEAEEFRRVAFQRMNKELDRQVYPDGAQIELTPHYHQVSRRNFMDLAEVTRMNDVSLPEGYMSMLKRMYTFNLKLMDPSGHLPPFNDARRVETTGSLKEAYNIWGDNEFLFGATLGKKGEKPDFGSYFFNYAGYYAMRSGWDYMDNCLYFDAGPVGEGHIHEDKLNLYLYSHGRVLLTEPGSYSYDKSRWRKYVLTTPAHNTIIVDGKYQHRGDIPESRLIEEPLKNPWVSTPLFDYGKGVYSSGYQRCEYRKVQYSPIEYVGKKDQSISHTRHVIFLKPHYYVVVDFLEGKGEHKYDAYFHLNAPSAEMDEESKEVHTLRYDNVQLGLYPMDRDNLNGKIVKGQKNPILGWLPSEKKPIPTLVYSKEENAPATFSTLLYPYSGEKPEVTYEGIMEEREDVWGKNITTPHETVSFILNRNQSAISVDSKLVSSFSADSEIILVRKPGNKTGKYLGFSDISKYEDKQLSFRVSSPSPILIKKAGKKQFLYNPMDKPVQVSFMKPFERQIMLPAKKWMRITSSGAIKREKG